MVAAQLSRRDKRACYLQYFNKSISNDKNVGMTGDTEQHDTLVSRIQRLEGRREEKYIHTSSIIGYACFVAHLYLDHGLLYFRPLKELGRRCALSPFVAFRLYCSTTP